MLNWNNVLTYVKSNLSLPSTFIEDDDNTIKEWIKLTALKEFSNYFPDVERTCVIPDNDNYKHETRQNWYYFFDEGDCDIIGIKECYFSINNDMMSGHPLYGPWSFNGIGEWALNVFKSRFFAPFSNFAYTYKFFQPNVVQVLPGLSEAMVVEYERSQPADLSRVPVSLSTLFMDLSLSSVMIKLGRLRMHYGGNLNSPFGEIPLNGESLLNEGKEIHEKCLQTMIDESLPPVVIDIY